MKKYEAKLVYKDDSFELVDIILDDNSNDIVINSIKANHENTFVVQYVTESDIYIEREVTRVAENVFY